MAKRAKVKTSAGKANRDTDRGNSRKMKERARENNVPLVKRRSQKLSDQTAPRPLPLFSHLIENFLIFFYALILHL